MLSFNITWITSMLSVNLLLCSSAVGLNAQMYERVPKLHGENITFPITLINGYPFISATVNGSAGKFMFDTGFGTTIMLNDDFIKLPQRKLKGDGVVASGQSFKTSINDTIEEIGFANGISYRNLEQITSGNYGFIQKVITPDFLGFIGHGFFKGYLFKIDYLHRKVTFYKNTPQRRISEDFLANEKVLAVIDFELRKRPNTPIIKLKIGGVDVIGAFDTGQNGFLQLNSGSAKELGTTGTVLTSGSDGSGDTLLSIKDIIIDGKLKTMLKGIEYNDLEGTQVSRRELSITEPNIMSIGYRFLSQYKTVWDYEHKKIYILEY